MQRSCSLRVVLLVCLGLFACSAGCDSRTSPSGSDQDNHASPPVADSLVEQVPESGEPARRSAAEPLNALLAAFTESYPLPHTYRNGQHRNQRSILESLGGGVGILDMDNDGRPDICLAGGGDFPGNQQIVGYPTTLFHNRTNSGSERLQFEDRSQQSRLDLAPYYYSHGVAVGDYDNDGFSDVLITGYGGLLLWHNQGDGTFIEVASSAGVVSTKWSSSAAWGDLNGDGNLDLFVVNYVDWSFDNHPRCLSATGELDICPPKDFSGVDDMVFINDGEGLFEQTNHSLGLVPGGKGLGVLLADFNADARLDAYVANDTTDNFLYLNSEDALEESGGLRGVAVDDRGVPNGSMGVAGLDFNRDGLLDIWVTNYEEEPFALYRNDVDGFFVHVSHSAGVTSLGQQYVGFGTAAADFDLDGSEDLVVANGHVILFPQRAPRRQRPLLLQNKNGRFQRVPADERFYFGQPHEGRGLAVADLNDDGWLDLAISHLNEPAAVLMNNRPSTANWLKVKLVGTLGNRDAIGAVAVLVTSHGEQTRQVMGGGSYLSSHEPMLHWGIPTGEQLLELRIRWPSGHSQTLRQLQPNQTQLIIESGNSP